MNFGLVLDQVLVLFIILVIGFVAGKAGIIDSTGSKKLAGVMLYVASPMLVLKSFFISYDAEKLRNIAWMMGLSFLMFFVSILLSKLIYGRFPDDVSTILRFAAIFPNGGYMGLPLLYALYGDDGVFYGSFYIVSFHTILWTYGYNMFGGKRSKRETIRKILTVPSIIAVFAGMIVFVSGIPVPSPVEEAVKYVGNMTMPISMLIVGSVISSARLREIFSDWRVYLSCFVRLILMPLIALAITKIPGIPSMPATVLATALTMPSAANTTVFSEMFDKDSLFAAKCVSVSTLMSIITIPILVSLI